MISAGKGAVETRVEALLDLKECKSQIWREQKWKNKKDNKSITESIHINILHYGGNENMNQSMELTINGVSVLIGLNTNWHLTMKMLSPLDTIPMTDPQVSVQIITDSGQRHHSSYHWWWVATHAIQTDPTYSHQGLWLPNVSQPKCTGHHHLPIQNKW